MGRELINLFYHNEYNIIWIAHNEQQLVLSTKIVNKIERKSLLQNKEYTNTISCFTGLEELSGCDFVIECISENVEKKQLLIKQLNGLLQNETILLTNTSSIPINDIFKFFNNRSHCLGLHFFYPTMMVNSVEINYVNINDDNVLQLTKSLIDSINKQSVFLSENNHFVFNRLLLPYQAESYNLLIEYSASPDYFDSVTENNLFPIGPFKMMDQIGLDIIGDSISNYLQNEESPSFYQPLLKMLKRCFNNEYFGKKNNRGINDFFQNQAGYDNDKCLIDTEKIDINERLMLLFVNSFIEEIKKKYCDPQLLNTSLKDIFFLDNGPLDFIIKYGKKNIINKLNILYKKTGIILYKPDNELINNI